jgi:MFS transporter, PPP family, 3-phenylpropionic acid transporter
MSGPEFAARGLGLQLRSARKGHRLSAILSSQGSRTATGAFTGPGNHRSLSVMRRMPPTLLTFAAVYALLYAAFGVQSPFLPALLGEQGLFPQEIGIVLAASTAIRVVAGPVIGHAADRRRRHTSILCGCALVAAVAGLGYLMMQGLGSLLIVGLLHAAMLAPIVPLSDALATTAARESESDGRRRFDYGWLRASGSAAFIIGTMLSGWAAGKAGLPSIIWISGALLAIGGITALILPKLPVEDATHNGVRSPIVRDWALLLRLTVYRRMLIIAALVLGSHALQDTFAVIRWRAAGINLSTVSLLWSESVLSEVVVFLLIGPWLVRLLGPGGACALAAGAGVIRWTVVAFTTAPVLLGVVQPLHGLTFALLHLACMRLIVQVVPVRLAATAQSIYGTLCVGLATALLILASGMLYERMGGHAFLIMAALCLLALPMCAGLRVSRVSA